MGRQNKDKDNRALHHGRFEHTLVWSRNVMSSRVVKSNSISKRIQSSNLVVLERVLGFTLINNCALSLDSESGVYAYAAGCVVVLRSFEDDRQRFIQSNHKKAITAVEFSPDGRYVATGESGHQPMVRVWTVSDCSQHAEFAGHHFRVIAVRFSPSGRYLVSLGSQEDNTLYVWDRITKQKVASAKITNKVNSVAFSPDGQYFVTVGVRHVRYWYLETKRTRTKETIPLNGRNAVLGDMLNNSFMDVCCLARRTNDSQSAQQGGSTLTLVVSKAGQLLQFSDQRYLDKWVELRTTKASCLSVHGSTVAVGCTHGTCLLFNAESLQFLAQVPTPHQLGSDSLFTTSQTIDTDNTTDPLNFADLMAVRLDCIHARLICFYTDHSLYVWNIGDLSNIHCVSSNLYHSRGVWSIDCLSDTVRRQNGRNPSIFETKNDVNHSFAWSSSMFVTCSDDGTIRFWDLLDEQSGGTSYTKSTNDLFSTDSVKEKLVRIIHTDPTRKYLCVNDRVSSGVGILGGPPPSSSNGTADPISSCPSSPTVGKISDSMLSLSTCSSNSTGSCIRTVAVSPDCCHLASGDREGTLRVYSLKSLDQIAEVAAHDGEILSLSFFRSDSVPELSLLCSASRDRLIHIFDPNQNFSLVQTVADHSAAIFAARIIETEDDGEIRLISCGMDKSLLIRILEPDEAGLTARFTLEHHLVGRSSQLDAAFTPNLGPSNTDNKSSLRKRYLTVACQDRRLRIYNVATGRQIRCYRGSFNEEGCLIRCTVDPTGSVVATSGSDKQLNLFHLLSGESITTLCGHSELCLGIRFLPSLQHLVTISSDGCIFVWRLAPNLTNLLSERPLDRSTSLSTVSLATSSSRSLSSFKLPQAFRLKETKECASDDISSLLRSPRESSSMRQMFDSYVAENGADQEQSTISSPSEVSNGLSTGEHTKGVNSGATSSHPAFYFSVSALPAWARRKLNRRCSVTLVPSSATQGVVKPLAQNHESESPSTGSSDSLNLATQTTQPIPYYNNRMTTSEYRASDRSSGRPMIKDSRHPSSHRGSSEDSHGSAPCTPFRRVQSTNEYDRCRFSHGRPAASSSPGRTTNSQDAGGFRDKNTDPCSLDNVAGASQQSNTDEGPTERQKTLRRVEQMEPTQESSTVTRVSASFVENTSGFDPTQGTSFPRLNVGNQAEDLTSYVNNKSANQDSALSHTSSPEHLMESAPSSKCCHRATTRNEFFSELETTKVQHSSVDHDSPVMSPSELSPLTARSRWKRDRKPSDSPLCESMSGLIPVRPKDLSISSPDHHHPRVSGDGSKPPSPSEANDRLNATFDALSTLQEALIEAVQRCTDYKAHYAGRAEDLDSLGSFVSEELQWRFVKLRAVLGLKPMCVDPPVARALLSEFVEHLVPELRSSMQSTNGEDLCTIADDQCTVTTSDTKDSLLADSTMEADTVLSNPTREQNGPFSRHDRLNGEDPYGKEFH